MKQLLCAAFLMLGPQLKAEDIAVFAKNEIVVGATQASGAIPADADKRAFLERFRDDRRTAAKFESSLTLVNPPAWGKTVANSTHGEVSYHPEFAHGFVCHLTLKDLLPNHAYILTLNGNPEKKGNEELPTLVPGMKTERFYDFLFVETDAHGAYEATLGIYLKQAAYDVRIYVKDTADFKIVLYRDYFPFTVK